MTDCSAKIKCLFRPECIAVIGASANPNKIGNRVVHNILSGGYNGIVHPVNPGGGEILGLETKKSILDVGDAIDLALISIPSHLVFGAIKECAEAKVKNAAIITSGFSEIGNIEEERRIVRYAKEHGVRVLGPNIFGLYSSGANLNATFAAGDIDPGEVGIITQSGAIGIAMIGKTAADRIGLSAIVSVGNKSDIDEADLLEYLIGDEKTRTILMYIEGVKNGARMIDVLKRATSVKPVIVIKSGRSKRGAVAVASHTGSLAGSDEIFDAIMKQCGVLRAESVQEAFNWSFFLSKTSGLSGESAVIVTNGGGIGVLATDACEKFNIKLHDDAARQREVFKDSVPEFGSFKNPIDITGGATHKDYGNALRAALDEDDFHAVLALYCDTGTMEFDKLEGSFVELNALYKGKKPLVFSLFGGQELVELVRRLRKRGVPVFEDVYEAVSTLGALYFIQGRRKTQFTEPAGKISSEFEIDVAKIQKVISFAQSAGRNFLLAPEAQSVMMAAGIPIPKSVLVKNLHQSVEAAEKIGYPVVMKVVSKDIVHKSDAGGVALDLLNKQEVMDAYEVIIHNCRQYNKRAEITGIEVTRMVESGVETIIGARRDATYGPIMMFGLGGIYVEVMKDVSFRSLPISRAEAREMISEIRSYPILLGVRGEPTRDIETVTETMLKVGSLTQRVEAITDIEINPLLAYEKGKGCLAVDARILISNPMEKTNE